MAPSSLKKMRGSRGRKEGNYASSDGSTSLDVFTSDNLGLTLLPGPQIQKKDERETVQAAIDRPRETCTTEKQRDGQPCPLELEEHCQTATRRSTVDESIIGSCYIGLSTGVERYPNTGNYDDEAVLRPDECCSEIQGNHDLRRNDFSLLTGTRSKDIGNGLHHDRKADTKYFRAPYHSSLAIEGREIERDILFNSLNQVFEEEGEKISLNGTSGSLDSVVGNEYDHGKNSDAKACENLPEHKFCGSKGKKSENLLLTSSSGSLGGLTFTKPIADNRLSKGYSLILSTDSAQKPHHSTRTPESENTCSVIPETNNHSHIASAFLSPVELQGSSKAIPTAHQPALNSLQLSPQLILKPPQASRNLHIALPKKASKSVRHLKRSWTRHFPTRSKNLPSRGSQNSDHAHTSSATPSCSIASERNSNSLKTCFARENRYKIVTHLNSRNSPIAPPDYIETSSRASYNSERDTFNNIDDTGIVQSRLKAGIKRSNSLPNLCLLHQSSKMYPQHGHQPYQVPTPLREYHAVDENRQNPDPNHTFLPANHAAHSALQDIHGDMNTPLMGVSYEHMHANVGQQDQFLSNPNMGASIYGYPQVQLSVHGPSQTQINYPISTNDGLMNSNGNRFYTTAEYMTLNLQCMDLSRRVQNYADALQIARERDQISKAKIKELERASEDLRQQLKSVTTKDANLLKDGVKVKSSGNRSVARTVDWARQSHPTAAAQSPNARSASSENKSIQLRDGYDGPSMKSGATIHTMVSPTQRQHASVPALAMGCPSTPAEHVQAPYSVSFQSEAQFVPGPYNPTYSPSSHPFGQYSSNGSQPGHSFQNQANEFQPRPGDDFVGYDQQRSPQLSVSHTLPTAVQAETSTSGVKRKRQAEPDVAQVVKRQQQPVETVETQSGLSPEQAASDDQARSEAWKNMSRKDLAWYDGVHPFKHTTKEGKQFGIPSASLPQVTPHPALAVQAPGELIAPTPGKACQKTTPKTPTKRGVPKSDAEKKLIRAGYNKRYKDKKKANERIEKKAAKNLEASETTLPLTNAASNDNLHPRRPFDSAQEAVNEQTTDSNDSLDEDSEIKEPHGNNEESDDNNSEADGLSAAEQALAAELEDAMMNDDPMGQAVDDATDRTIMEIIDGEEDEEDEDESEEE